MRKIAAAVAALFVTSASSWAADMPPGSAPVLKASPAPAFTWTGFYVGANAGFGWSRADLTIGGLTGTDDLKGAIAGGQVGYNWQTGNIVLGLETDAQWSDQRLNSALGGISAADRLTWFSTFRGRVGYTVEGWLLYVTGGGAYGEFKADWTSGANSLTWKESHAGWSAGAGIETAFSAHWSAKVEYLHFDTGSFSTSFFGTPATVSLKDNVVRAGVNYRF